MIRLTRLSENLTSRLATHLFYLYSLFLGTCFIDLGFFPVSSWDQKWLWIFVMILVLLFRTLCWPQVTILVPTVHRLVLAIGLLAVACATLSLVINRGVISWSRIGERLCFFVLFVYFYQSVMRQPSQFFRYLRIAMLFSLAVMIVSLYARCGFANAPNVESCSYPYFENRNMFTQGLVLLLLILLSTFAKDFASVTKRTPLVVGSSIVTVAAVCFHLQARTSLLALLALLTIFLLAMAQKKFANKWFILLCVFTTFAFVVGLYLKFPFLNSSSFVRLRLVHDAWQIVLKNQWGVGIGNFQWAQLPYDWRFQGGKIHNLFFFKSPHNEFLRLAAEEGLLTAVASYMFLFAWVWQSRKDLWHQNAYGLICKVGFGSFFVLETSFQFPFENPFPSVGLAYALALFSPKCETDPIVLATAKAKTLITGLILYLELVFAAQFYFLATRKFAQVHPAFDRFLCGLSVEYWPLCVESANFLVVQNQQNKAVKVLLKSLTRQPNNYILFNYLVNVTQQNRLYGDVYATLLGHGSGQISIRNWDDYQTLVSQVTKRASGLTRDNSDRF